MSDDPRMGHPSRVACYISLNNGRLPDDPAEAMRRGPLPGQPLSRRDWLTNSCIHSVIQLTGTGHLVSVGNCAESSGSEMKDKLPSCPYVAFSLENDAVWDAGEATKAWIHFPGYIISLGLSFPICNMQRITLPVAKGCCEN